MLSDGRIEEYLTFLRAFPNFPGEPQNPLIGAWIETLVELKARRKQLIDCSSIISRMEKELRGITKTVKYDWVDGNIVAIETILARQV